MEIAIEPAAHPETEGCPPLGLGLADALMANGPCVRPCLACGRGAPTPPPPPLPAARSDAAPAIGDPFGGPHLRAAVLGAVAAHAPAAGVSSPVDESARSLGHSTTGRASKEPAPSGDVHTEHSSRRKASVRIRPVDRAQAAGCTPILLVCRGTIKCRGRNQRELETSGRS